MNSSKFWTNIWKFNAIAIAVMALLAIAMLAMSIAQTWVLGSLYSGTSGFDESEQQDERDFTEPAVNEFEVIEGTPYLVVRIAQKKTTASEATNHSYGDGYEENVVQERNAMIINGDDGSSRLILPDNDRALVRWHVLNDKETSNDQAGYVALVTSRTVVPQSDKSDEKQFDVLVGNFGSKKQAFIVKNVNAIDSVRLVEGDKAALIVWNGWTPTWILVDMKNLNIIRSKKFPFPAFQAVRDDPR